MHIQIVRCIAPAVVVFAASSCTTMSHRVEPAEVAVHPSRALLIPLATDAPPVDPALSSDSQVTALPPDRSAPLIAGKAFGEANEAISPPWKIGPVPLSGTGNGIMIAPFHELVLFDIRGGPDTQSTRAFSTGEVGGATTGLSFGIAWSAISVEALVGMTAFTDKTGGDVDTDAGPFGAIRVGYRAFQLNRVAVGLDAAIGGGQARIDSAAGSGSELKWLQGDIRAGAAWSPSPDALLALAPQVGIGLRIIDGLQDLKSPSPADEEFEATLGYGYLGASGIWRPTTSIQAGLEAQVMIGDLKGVVVALVVIL